MDKDNIKKQLLKIDAEHTDLVFYIERLNEKRMKLEDKQIELEEKLKELMHTKKEDTQHELPTK